MKNTLDIRTAHKAYEDFDPDGEKRDCVDQSFRAVQDIFERFQFKTAFNDRAEELVAAIAQYLIDSEN